MNSQLGRLGLAFAFLYLNLTNAFAQSTILGKWKTVDDTSGKTKSIVEVFERSGKIYGKIVRLFPETGEDPDPVCNECSADDPRHKKKIIGMEIIRNLIRSGEEYGEGDILDPEVGKVYRCKIWLEGNDLKVRGYWGVFFRTQTWKKSI